MTIERIPKAIRNEISVRLTCSLRDFEFASGGCINNGGRISTSKGPFFLKWNSSKKFPNMFFAEAKGLALLHSTSPFKIPTIVTTGITEDFQFLLLEFIDQAKPITAYWKKLGEKLSELHHQSASAFGLDFDNYIGSIPQRNTKNTSWVNFFIEERLKPQVTIALNDGKLSSDIAKKFDRLFDKLPQIVVEEKPSLLHGDLWSGNLMVDNKGEPCLIDPAVYYGNREVEIAFTLLFGGFATEFYDTYEYYFPFEKGADSRFDLYNLYPLLVHVNLFGGGYLGQVVSILKNYV